MQIVNLTPQSIDLYNDDGSLLISFPPSAAPAARLTEHLGAEYATGGLPFRAASTYSAPTGLPDPKPGVLYIVSTMVAQAVDREDLLSPGGATIDVVRDATGRMVGTKRLIRWGAARLQRLINEVRTADSTYAASEIVAAEVADEWLAHCLLYGSIAQIWDAWWATLSQPDKS